MIRKLLLPLCFVVACLGGPFGQGAPPRRVHLFILSGQSNMATLNPEVSFTPTIAKAFPGDEIIVVKDAHSGQPIGRWYTGGEGLSGQALRRGASLYSLVMEKVKAAVEGKKIDTVTFVWMQGEADAKQGHAAVYAARLKGLIEQLRTDLGRPDMNCVIGRLSDHGLTHKIPGWQEVRQAQEEVANADPHSAWVDTDELNGPNDALHYMGKGRLILGERFALKAIDLIRHNPIPRGALP